MLVPPFALFCVLALLVNGSRVQPMKTWGGREHQVRLRRRGGETGAGETARGANRPPTAAAGKGTSLSPLG